MLIEDFNVRFCETDALAHVSNTVLVDWFEMAREPIFRIFTPELDLQNWPLILAGYKVDFLDQMHYGHPVQVRTSAVLAVVRSTPIKNYGKTAPSVRLAPPLWSSITTLRKSQW